MKKICFFFFLFFTFSFFASAQIQRVATLVDWYHMADAVFHWDAMNIPLDNVPAFAGDTALMRAYTLGLMWDTSSYTYIYPLTYSVVGNNLQELFFPDTKDYSGMGYSDPWYSVKWKLHALGINIDSLESLARGTQYYTGPNDVVSGSVWKVFQMLAAKIPTIVIPVIETTAGDTTVAFMEYKSDAPIRAFRTILTDISTGTLNVSGVGGDFSYQMSRGVLRHNYYSVDEFSIAGMLPGSQWKQSLGTLFCSVPTAGMFSVYQRNSIVSDNNGNDSPVLGEKTLVYSYDRADVNKNFSVSIGDAVVMSNMLLRGEAFSPSHLGDMNYNGVQDPDDVTEIMHAALWTGGLGKISASVASTTAASAEGKLVFDKTAGGYQVFFTGNLASKRLALSLSFDPAAKFENVAYNQKTTAGITGWYYENGKLNVLMYADSLTVGNLLEISFSGAVPDVKISPLGANYFSDSEKIDVVNNSVTGVDNKEETPKNFGLFQNYPNPFNPETAIRFELKSSRFVKLKVYNTLGQEVRTLVNGMKPAGSYEVTFNASSLPSGTYIYRIQAGDFVAVKKMILLK